jgi:hypothetical protein
MKSVRVYGYKPPLPDGVTRQEAVSFGKEYEAKQKRITPAARKVYSGKGDSSTMPPGVPDGGCSGKARRQAKVDQLNNDMMAVQKLFWEGSAATRKDPRIVELDRRWSSCMEKLGIRYPDPLAAVGDPKWRKEKTAGRGPSPYFPAPSGREIRTAEADVRCKAGTDYIKTRSDVESEYQRELIRKHTKMLAAVQERRKNMVNNLFSIVADGK